VSRPPLTPEELALIVMPWSSRDVARRAMDLLLDDIVSAVAYAERDGGMVRANIACLLSQELEGPRIQIFHREVPPRPEMGQIIEDSLTDEVRGAGLPVVLWSIRGKLWVVWVRLDILAKAGDA
jgi:hypothetical protein